MLKPANLTYISSILGKATKVKTPLLDESGTAENKVEVLFSHDKLLLASILRLLHQVTEEMLV